MEHVCKASGVVTSVLCWANTSFRVKSKFATASAGLLLRHVRVAGGTLVSRGLATSSLLRSHPDTHIISSPCPDIVIDKEHFADYIFKDAVEKHGDKLAFVSIVLHFNREHKYTSFHL